MSRLEAVEEVLEGLRLTNDERYRIALWLQRDWLKRQWQILLKRIDRRVKKYGRPSDEEIVEWCRQVRRERHERSAKGPA